MNKVEVTLIEIEPLTLRHAGDHVVVIDTEMEFDHRTLKGYFLENLEEFRRAAARNVAAARTDYESYGSDSAYLDRLDAISECFYLDSVGVPGVKTRQYSVEGIYPGDGGMWGDDVEACCRDEAEFQGQWVMSVNAGYELDTYMEAGDSPTKAVESLTGQMEDQEMTRMTDIVRPTARDAERLIFRWMEAASAGQFAKLKADLQESGGEFIERLNEQPSDEIVLLEETVKAVQGMTR